MSTTSRAGVTLLGEERGPQPGVPPADDEQVAVLVADEGGAGAGLVRIVEPVRDGLGVGE
jgi:hypothetical protein